MFEWEEQDRFSFEDSDRFEEDSLCSWISEPESVVNNWRGWRKQGSMVGRSGTRTSPDTVLSLTELAAREVASSIPFEAVERVYPPVPEPLQLRIAFYSFPDLEEDIRLYSCLAHGSADEFNRGEILFKNKAVKDPLQIGFHLSAMVGNSTGTATATTASGRPLPGGNTQESTSVTFDRKKIVSCQCSCRSSAEWCCHLVALCLHRIHWADTVKLRAPVSESLSRLQRDQLQKFAQYLISELPQQILPTAQRLLDELLSGAQSLEINTVSGAPDPTAGGSVGEQSAWCLDSKNLRDNIKKILIKFCMPAPIVFSDVNYLSTTAPPSAAEWSSFLRPLRGREPEGMWNLLSIVREMYKRNDRNSIPLLEIVTLQCLETAQIMIWWFNTKVAFQQAGQSKHNVNSNSQASQNACSSMCDEIVTLWKLAALNPCISPRERETLKQRLSQYHTTVIEKVQTNQANSSSNSAAPAATASNKTSSGSGHKPGKLTDIEIFSGFKPAIEACFLDWEDYPINGVTYGSNPKYLCPFTVFRSPVEAGESSAARAGCSQVNSSQAVLRCEYPGGPLLSVAPSNNGVHHHLHRPRSSAATVAAADLVSATMSEDAAALKRSSLSSEEAASDEGVEEAPSQSEGESGGIVRDCLDDLAEIADGFPESTSGRSYHHHQLLKSGGSFRSNASSDEICDGTGNAGDGDNIGKREAESSPERDLESDWSSGQSEMAQAQAAAGTAEQNQSLPAAAVAFSSPSSLPPVADSHDYRVYFYDPKIPVSTANDDGSKPAVDIFKNVRHIEDPWEILFMRAEGIHAHGYQSHACEMAVRLALDMLKNPPDLITDAPPLTFSTSNKGKKRRVCAASHQITHTASTTLTHCAFLCTVLSETAHSPFHLNLAFQIGMFGLEMARPPASTKPMEVKLAHQESELVALLKRLPLGPAELAIVRERALQLKEGTLKSRGEALLPLMLASFIFESLVLPRSSSNFNFIRTNGDELLGFEAAVAAIGLKANVSEADHPLLCEGTRRQRGDLVLMLLVHYKDDAEKLARIMDKLLDKDIHQMFKSPILASYYMCRPSVSAAVATAPAQQQQMVSVNVPPPGYPLHLSRNDQQQQPVLHENMANLSLGARPRERMRRTSREEADAAAGRSRPTAAGPQQQMDAVGSPPPDWDSFKAWEAKFRCTNLRVVKPRTPGHHMASIDSSAPETASSDNSPTLIRRFRPPPSDSGSSGNSSDSSGGGSRSGRPHSPGSLLTAAVSHNMNQPNLAAAGRGSSLDEAVAAAAVNAAAAASREVANCSGQLPVCSSSSAVSMMEMTNLTRTTLPNIKVTRFKGKRAYPSVPNQPSEASAHFMFELAKTVLTKAGGTSTTSLFTQPTANQNPRGPQRALHMCAFQIGLYALGLHNRVSPNWISRTYSSHVSWITGQAMEIGATAISFLISTWEGHLTPPEAANIADRASRGRDAGIVTAAAELALSCLSHAHALNPSEIARAILQCKEQSDLMLEKACLAVEEAARGGGVYPEVMFTVAKYWYELYKAHSPPGNRGDELLNQRPAVSSAGVMGVMDGGGGLGLYQPPPPVVSLAQQQQITASMPPGASSGAAGGHHHPHPLHHPHMQLGMQFPIYSLIQAGFPGATTSLPPQIPLHMQMYVGPPQHHHHAAAAAAMLSAAGLSVPNSLTGAAHHQAAFPFPGLAGAGGLAGLPGGLHLFPNVSEAGGMGGAGAGPRFNLAAGGGTGPLLHLALPGVSLPLLPTPPQPPPPGGPQHHLHQQQGLVAPPPLLPHPAPTASPLQAPPPPVVSNGSHHHHHHHHSVGSVLYQRYLLSAFRVGMLALETLGRRVSEDRPQTKFTRNPSYAEDVKWLLGVAKKVGLPYLQNFLMCVMVTVVSPFVLQDLTWDCGCFLTAAQPGAPTASQQHFNSAVVQQIRSQPYLTSLAQKCYQMYYQCIHQRLYHLTPAEYEDFTAIIIHARKAFMWTASGQNEFQTLLTSLRRTKSCKKELWSKITAAVQNAGMGGQN